jgi:transposase
MGDEDPRLGRGDGFLPILCQSAAAPREDERPATADGKIEIALSSGHRLSISGAYDPEALARLLRNLSG